MMGTCDEQSSLFLFPVRKTYVLYPTKRDDVAWSLHLEEIQILPDSEFIDHSYFQHPAPLWKGQHGIRRHIFNKPNVSNWKDAVALAFGSSLRPMVLESTEKPARIGLCLRKNLTKKSQRNQRSTKGCWSHLTYLKHITHGVVQTLKWNEVRLF